MSFPGLRSLAVLLCAALVGGPYGPAFAQSAGDAKPPDQPKAADAKPTDQQKATDAARKPPGPAGNEECVWLGERVINLLYRDDLDTAFRHLDLYDRFGCPGAHIQVSFRCLVRQDPIDLKSAENILEKRVRACWDTPAMTAASAPPPATPAAAAPAPAAPATPAPPAAPAPPAGTGTK
ncbi:MAG TPA: beta-1-3, beta-1-6-glucan biosynthesis protein [Xanthobacteraceae bacterium]